MAKRVYLSPSDQRRNTYAVGDTTEDVQCGRIAAACKAALERSGVEVMVGQYDTMANRVAASNRFKADLHVPIHTNAANGKATGTHIFCYDANRNSAGYKACREVLGVLGPVTPGSPDVVRAYPALYEVKHPAAPTVYISRWISTMCPLWRRGSSPAPRLSVRPSPRGCARRWAYPLWKAPTRRSRSRCLCSPRRRRWCRQPCGCCAGA